MGKKGKKASKKSSSRNANSSSSKSNSNATGARVKFCVPEPPEPTSTNYIDRPIPDSSLGDISYLSNLNDRLNDILSSNREVGSLPTNDELSKLKSKTAKRVAIALARFEIAKYYIQSDYLCNLSENIEMAKPLQVSMEKLLHKDSFLEACVHVTEAMSSTDTRLDPCSSSFIQHWPIPTSYRMPVEYHPLNQGEIQMPDMTHEEFVVLLATTLTVGTTTLISGQEVLRMIHELYLQANHMDWSKFESRKHLNPLTENSCRNALAGIGIKACKRLFRMDKADRCAGEDDMKLSSKALLREIEVFARDQMKYAKSGYGEFNMAWIAQQSSAVLKVDPLSAAADALHWFTKSYIAADKYGNDFLSGAARIDAAHCMLYCGEGVLKIPTPVHDFAFVRRDFRTEFGEKKDIRLDEKTKQGYSLFSIDILDAIDRQHAYFANKYELDRLGSGKPITVLTKEEGHFIHWKKVLALWNEAMKYYDRMTEIGMGYFIFGESACWINVISQIREFVDKKKLPLSCEYHPPLDEPGLSVAKDIGLGVCANCGNARGNKKCSACQEAVYCSRDCQKQHWKVHKLTCCKK